MTQRITLEKAEHNLPSFSDVEKYYITENHSLSSTAEHFGLSYSVCQHYILEVLHIKKSRVLGARNNKKSKLESFQYRKMMNTLPVYEDVYLYFIEQNHTGKETASHFGFTIKELDKLLSYLDIKKDASLRLENTRSSLEETYGTKSFFQTEEGKKKTHQYQRIVKDKGIDEKVYLINSDKDQFIQYIKDKGYKPTISEIALEFGYDYGTIQGKVNKWNLQDLFDMNPSYSQAENEICRLLDSWGISYTRNNRDILDDQLEIDIYCPANKIGIEFNGDYWHSSLNKNKNYHYHKSLVAYSKGIRLIHIYEYEWNNPKQKEKIIEMLKQALKCTVTHLYARQCEIKTISNKEAKVLNDLVHLQGHRNAQVTYGLFYENKLVQLMSFSKTKYNRNLKDDNQWEIIRGCPGSNIMVIGGVSRLFKHFIEDYKPSLIFSYCDFNKFDGVSYEKIGMKCVGYTGPDKTWLIQGKAVKRNPHRYKELKEKATAIIWGAGSKKYVWIKKE